jgi:hypothetical protein
MSTSYRCSPAAVSLSFAGMGTREACNKQIVERYWDALARHDYSNLSNILQNAPQWWLSQIGATA